MDVKLIKLISGEEVICTVEPVVDSPEPLLRLCNPAALVQGPRGTAMVEWPRFASLPAVEIRNAHIMCVADVKDEQVLKVYTTMITGIETLPEKKLIV